MTRARLKANRRKRLKATDIAFCIEDKIAGLPPRYRKLNNNVGRKEIGEGSRANHE
jgi:hypothetical protein